MRLSSVLLPDPLLPNRTTNSPRAIAAAELSPAAAAAAADPSLAAAAAELSPAAARCSPLIHHLLLPAAELSPAAAAAAADPSLAAADAAEDAKTCSKDTLTPIIAVIITTAKITGILVFI